jgi:NAD dependent epimerase/dehydratase family enzyme
VNYSEKFDNKEEKDKDFVSKLFDNWEKTNEKVADLYNLRIVAYLQALQKQSEVKTSEVVRKE